MGSAGAVKSCSGVFGALRLLCFGMVALYEVSIGGRQGVSAGCLEWFFKSYLGAQGVGFIRLMRFGLLLALCRLPRLASFCTSYDCGGFG